MPSGNTSEATQAYYESLYRHYLAGIVTPHTSILWAGPIFIALWAATLILFFFCYTWFARRTHRSHGALYGVSSFAGAILERIGPVSPFSWFVWIIVTLYALYFLVTHLLAGQVY